MAKHPLSREEQKSLRLFREKRTGRAGSSNCRLCNGLSEAERGCVQMALKNPNQPQTSWGSKSQGEEERCFLGVLYLTAQGLRILYPQNREPAMGALASAAPPEREASEPQHLLTATPSLCSTAVICTCFCLNCFAVQESNIQRHARPLGTPMFDETGYGVWTLCGLAPFLTTVTKGLNNKQPNGGLACFCCNLRGADPHEGESDTECETLDTWGHLVRNPRTDRKLGLAIIPQNLPPVGHFLPRHLLKVSQLSTQ